MALAVLAEPFLCLMNLFGDAVRHPVLDSLGRPPWYRAIIHRARTVPGKPPFQDLLRGHFEKMCKLSHTQ